MVHSLPATCPQFGLKHSKMQRLELQQLKCVYSPWRGVEVLAWNILQCVGVCNPDVTSSLTATHPIIQIFIPDQRNITDLHFLLYYAAALHASLEEWLTVEWFLPSQPPAHQLKFDNPVASTRVNKFVCKACCASNLHVLRFDSLQGSWLLLLFLNLLNLPPSNLNWKSSSLLSVFPCSN